MSPEPKGGYRDYCLKILAEGESKATTIDGSERNLAPFYPQDTKESFAEQIILKMDIAQRAIEEGDAASAARFAFCAGELFERMRLKFSFELDADRGQKVAGGSKNSAHDTNKLHIARREQRMKRVRELTVTMSVMSACYQCEVEGLGSAKAIRGQWYRHRKKV